MYMLNLTNLLFININPDESSGDVYMYVCVIPGLVEVRSVGSLIVSRVDRSVIVSNILLRRREMTLLGPGQCQCQLTNVSWRAGRAPVAGQVAHTWRAGPWPAPAGLVLALES